MSAQNSLLGEDDIERPLQCLLLRVRAEEPAGPVDLLLLELEVLVSDGHVHVSTYREHALDATSPGGAAEETVGRCCRTRAPLARRDRQQPRPADGVAPRARARGGGRSPRATADPSRGAAARQILVGAGRDIK